MDKEKVREKVVGIISEQLGLSRDDIKMEDVVEGGLHHDGKVDQGYIGADSLDIVEIVMECEDVFGIQITESHQRLLRTVQDFVHHIYDRI